MYRYLALAWNSADPQKARVAAHLGGQLPRHEWHCVSSSPGLLVFHAGARPPSSDAYALANNRGVVLGKLFRRHDFSPIQHSVLDPEITGKICDTRGRWLIDHCWGRYVAFIQSTAGNAVDALRDPTGNLPCFVTTHEGIRVFFSRPADCQLLGLRSFSINWRYIAEHVCQRPQRVAETGLTEISELHPGERLTDLETRDLLWNPMQIACGEPLDDADKATSELRRVTRACIQSWASCYPGILHTLSGGLDSSIVASCLRDAPSAPKVTCLNYVTRDQEGNEVEFARSMASKLGFHLIELERTPQSVNLSDVLQATHSAKPTGYRYYIEHSRAEAKLAREYAAQAVFTGGGGDQLFFQGGAEFAATDALWSKGLSRPLARATWDAARVEGRTVWSILYRSIRDRFQAGGWQPFANESKYITLVNPDLARAVVGWTDLEHPWFRQCHGAPPGKLWHALMMSIPANFYDPLGAPDGPERVHPIVSQPVMETCLRIPTFVLISCGWDRAIARRAFAQDLPREIVLRRHKATIGEHSRQLFLANSDFVHELLRESLLVKHQILDRRRLQDFLANPQSLQAGEFAELLEYVGIEAWLKSWQSATPSQRLPCTSAR